MSTDRTSDAPATEIPASTHYQPEQIEQSLYRHWEANNWFAPEGKGAPYCIMIPPPNITGTLHMGHAFQSTLMDALIRYQRMQGKRVLWQVGTDHAGIATQMVVERQLEQQQRSRMELGREGFIAKVWDWKRQAGGGITRQLRRLGASLDWSRERFTLDEGFSRAVREVFVRLYDEGLIYRRQRLVNWDPVLKTALSDLEVQNTESLGSLWHFRYPLIGGRTTRQGQDHLLVATTRPETMFGDTAVAVHPDDERYADLVGAQVELPLVGRSLPIIADTHVDAKFGTGCVKITPAHDFNDHAVGERHKLPVINIFTEEAQLNEQVPEAYRGMDRFAARKQVVADMQAAELLARVDKHTLMIPCGDRSGAVIEPWLTDQWFVCMQPLAEPAIAAVQNGKVRFIPQQYENTYFAWMREIQDWCISRQLWWGHRIPAWYDDQGRVYVAEDEAQVRKKYGLSAEQALHQDADVLETWFSSALWSFATLGWPQETAELREFHPTNVLVTGHDIIFFWVARMIMMSLKFTGQVPFHTVYVHGLVRDAEGRKMSKSRGNGLDPLHLIDGIELQALVDKRTTGLMQPQLAADIEQSTRNDFPDGIAAMGADALRFTFCALASTGRDVRFDLNRIRGYRNFCNKLWNAASYVHRHAQQQDAGVTSEAGAQLSLADRWIRSRLQQFISDARLALDTYRFDLLAQHIYEFVWHEYCDWYLELTKPVLRSGSSSEREAARKTLLQVLEVLLRIVHPLIPFITETLWLRTAPLLDINGASIMLQDYPVANDALRDKQAEAEIEWVKAVIIAIRNIRGEMNVQPARAIRVLLADGTDSDRRRLTQHQSLLLQLARLETIEFLDAAASPPPAATALIGSMKVLLPIAGLIDRDAELARLDKEIARQEQELGRLQKKLDNANFIKKAPHTVVSGAQQKASAMHAALETLRGQRQQIANLSG